MTNMRKVMCVSRRESFPTQVVVGSYYWIDEATRSLIDGIVYASVYVDKQKQKYVGHLALAHFVLFDYIMLHSLVHNSAIYNTTYNEQLYFVESFEIGAKAWIYDIDVMQLVEAQVVSVVYRSSDTEYYDTVEDTVLIDSCKEDFNASAEFIEDDDCAYVFLRVIS